MHVPLSERTKEKAVDSVFGLIGSAVKDSWTQRKQQELIEAQKDKQIEIARARQDATDAAAMGAGMPETGGGQGHAALSEQELVDRIRRERQRTDCDLCQHIFDQLEHEPTERMFNAFPGAVRLMQAVEDGASQDRVDRIINEDEALQSVLEHIQAQG